jgi:hypothetical protein
MPDVPEWMSHPEAGAPAAVIAGGAEPDWASHPEVPPAPEPVKSVPMFRPAADALADREAVTVGAELPDPYAMLNPAWRNSVAREATSGATLGLSDKAAAAGRATLDMLKGSPEGWSGAYRKALDHIREQSNRFAETNPVASWGGYGAGTVASLPLIPVAKASTLGGRIAAGAGTGAGVGAVSGFAHTNDESLGHDLAAAGTGAALGTGIGGAGAGIADRVVSPIINWVSRRFSPEAANSQAIQVIADRMRQDTRAGGPSANDMLELFNAAGAENKPQMLADVAGENVKGLFGRIAREPGEGKQIIARALNDRDAAAGPRLAEDVTTGIGGGSAHDTFEALLDARSAAARPHYGAAFEQQHVWSPRLQEFINDPVMSQGLKRGMELERIDSITNRRPFDPTTLGVDLDPAGNVVLRTVPNLRVLDAGKRGLDSMIADERNAVTGRLSQRGVALDQFRRAYLNEIDGLDRSGTYAAARAAWEGPSKSMDAVRAGQSILEKSPDEIKAEIARLSPGDREFYRLGAADKMKEKLARTGMSGDESKKIIGNQYTQQQLRPLFDSQREYDRFINAVTAENRMFETRFNTLRGSQTAGRLAEDNLAGSEALGHAVRGGLALSEGALPAAAFSLLRSAGALSRGESPAVNAAAARMLTETRPQVPLTLAQILAAQRPAGRTPLLTAPMSSAAGAAYPSLTSVLASQRAAAPGE